MHECTECYGTGRVGWDVTPGRRKTEVTCKKCVGTGRHHEAVFKKTIENFSGVNLRPLTWKVRLYLLGKVIAGGFRWGKTLLSTMRRKHDLRSSI